MTVGELRKELAFVPGDTEVIVLLRTDPNHFIESGMTLRIDLVGHHVFILPWPPTEAEIEENHTDE